MFLTKPLQISLVIFRGVDFFHLMPARDYLPCRGLVESCFLGDGYHVAFRILHKVRFRNKTSPLYRLPSKNKANHRAPWSRRNSNLAFWDDSSRRSTSSRGVFDPGVYIRNTNPLIRRLKRFRVHYQERDYYFPALSRSIRSDPPTIRISVRHLATPTCISHAFSNRRVFKKILVGGKVLLNSIPCSTSRQNSLLCSRSFPTSLLLSRVLFSLTSSSEPL